MAYVAGNFDQAHIYVQWGGKLPGGEDWSCGLRMAQQPFGDATMTPQQKADIAAKISAFHQGNAASISSAAKLSFVKVNTITAQGTYRDDPAHQAIIQDAPGAGSTPPYPNQVALVVTLTTGFSRGPAHKGRFYLPLPVVPLGTDGLISSAAAQTVSGGVDSLVTNLNATTTDWKVAVFSRKLGAPAHRLVTGNLVGRVLDTQRRRRRKVGEDYQ